MERADHLQWSKDRAIEYVDNNDNKQAFASFMSDMSKHPELSNHLALEMGMSLLISNNLSTSDQMRNWILGFN
jgi:hypothetical protein